MRVLSEEDVKSKFEAMGAFDSDYSTGFAHDTDYTFFVWCACYDAVSKKDVLCEITEFERQLLSQLSHFGCLDSPL